ncbi:type IV conjugative transfer system protein TraL [Rhodoferax antarcticus]|uniref:type IV conjugative transfer system protein TraL n=1 Tax=Rhodoferax antarcticus TaxID=81479 RepID=UPI00094FEE0A|nr:type IV conjugative transfer system protein TraL [Rhodoferax antarcticus]
MKSTKIPRYIDSTPQLFFWELDEFVILMSGFALGILGGGLWTLVGLGFGFFLVNVFRKYKDGGLPGQLNHIAHWHNGININSRFPNGGVRRIFK